METSIRLIIIADPVFFPPDLFYSNKAKQKSSTFQKIYLHCINKDSTSFDELSPMTISVGIVRSQIQHIEKGL